MRLRTVTGTRFPAKCADGCGTEIPADPRVNVVVDFESRPRKTWIPEHSPDSSTWPPRGPRSESLPREPFPSGSERGSGSLGPDAGTWKRNGSTVPAASSRGSAPQDASSFGRPVCPPSSAQPAPTKGGNGHATGFQPASALPAPPPKAPEPPAQPYGPAPTPLALLGSAGASEPSPNPNSGATWATSSLTFNAGAYESAKSGFADFAKPGETPEALRQRVNAVVLSDIEIQVKAMRELHERLGDVPLRTSSPAPRAGPPRGPPPPPLPLLPPPRPRLQRNHRQARAGGGARRPASVRKRAAWEGACRPHPCRTRPPSDLLAPRNGHPPPPERTVPSTTSSAAPSLTW